MVELGRLHQVDGDEFGAEVGQRAEQLQIPGQRQPREIDLQKLRVAATIAGTVKHRVGVMENVFGGQAAWKILRFHLRYVKHVCQLSEKCGRKVWLAEVTDR